MPDGLFPAIEPYTSGWLEVSEGHRIRFEQCGRQDGVPTLFLHGGPGSNINANHRRFFDPESYRAVLFDQRGCGQSTPVGGIVGNTLEHLLADIERLREHLEVDRWLLFGGSWGSTLALAYAQRYPQRVTGMVLRGLFLGSNAEVEWFLSGLACFLPEAWTRFSAESADKSPVGLLRDFEERVRSGDEAAAARWVTWENAVMAVGEASSPATSVSSAGALARVRIQLHYLVHSCFLEREQLLRGLHGIASIPSILVQGRRDLVCPPITAYTVAQRWRGAELRIIEDGGHSAMHPSMAQALVTATQDIKQRLRMT